MAGLQATRSLLQLPRELRDQIYTYALYEPTGLHYRRSGTYKAEFTTQTCSDGLEYNQLQYTSRQLRHETLHLDRTLNTLIFQHTPTPQSRDGDDGEGNEESGKPVLKDPAVQFMGFLDTCSQASRLRLRHIRLHYNHCYPAPSCENGHQLPIDVSHNADLAIVAGFCEQYPNVTVWWHTRSLEYLFERHGLSTSVYNTVLEVGIVFACILRPNYDLQAVLEELHIPIANMNYWNRVFQCGCKMDLCWFNSRAGFAHDSYLFDQELEKYVQADNFRLLQDVDVGWEALYRKQAEERGISADRVEKRVKKMRDHITNGI
jgi:hypothetical protein